MSKVSQTDEFRDLAKLTPDEFQACLDQEFRIDLNHVGLNADGTVIRFEDAYPGQESATLKLVEVTQRPPMSPELRQDPFTLLFLGSHELPFFSDVHILEHPSIGRFTAALTSVNAGVGVAPEQHPDGRFYEVVFG